MPSNPVIDQLFPKAVYKVYGVLIDELPLLETAAKNIIAETNIKRTGSLNVTSTHSSADQLFLDSRFKSLADVCMLYAKDFMKQMVYDQYLVDNCKFHKMWTNISQQNDFLFPHIHGTCLIAGVFYIKAPTDAQIHFFDDLKNIKHQSQQYNHLTFEEYSYPCTPGSLLLFKNDMLHGNKSQPAGE